jgi:hypothetical protein
MAAQLLSEPVSTMPAANLVLVKGDWALSMLERQPSPAPYLKKPLDFSNRISYRGGWMHRTRSSGP